jgi:hypothetical protein
MAVITIQIEGTTNTARKYFTSGPSSGPFGTPQILDFIGLVGPVGFEPTTT